MTYAITLIASLLIAFTPGLPAQNPAPLKTFDATGQLIFEAKLSAGTQTSQPRKNQSTVDPTQIEKNPVPPTVSFSASGRVTTADGRGVPGVKIGFTLVSGKGQTPGEVETDAGGRWRQVGFSREGVYQIRLRRLPGDTFNTAKNDILRFPAGVINVSNKDFQITIPKVVASGKVRTRTRGTGLGNVTITFSVESGAGQVPAPITTNALGEWSQQFEIGAQYKATPSKGGFQFTPALITLSLLGAGGAQPGGLIRNLDFSVPDVFDVGGVITASDSRDDGADVTLEIRAVGGQSELICHKTRIGLPWSKQLETGKTYQIEPRKSHSFDGKIYVFTPNSTRVDGPKRNVNFSGRGDPNIVQQTRFAQSCP